MRIILSLLLVLGSTLAQEGGIETDFNCDVCHVGGDWNSGAGESFDHILTGYELSGIHAEIHCGSCHIGSTPKEKHQFGNVSSECSTCHEDIHNDQWGQDCERCHTPETWELSNQLQNHDLTNFPLQGPHRNLNCQSCHLNSPSKNATLSLECAGCHSQDYGRSENPSHTTLVLGNDCEACHAPTSSQWSNSIFDHNTTGYSLLGMHHTMDCASCHQGNVTNTPSQCYDCHRSDYESSIDPSHLIEGYPLDCQSCHDSFTWNSSFLHASTGFLLQGAHASTNCSKCHIDQNFSETPETCEGCHLNRWETTIDPPHDDADFHDNCEDCHSVTSWTPSLWQHDSDTEYPLTGAHTQPACVDCHTTIPYAQQPSECYDCHEADYNASVEPDHIESGIPTTCEVCHTTTDWDSEEIDHDQTDFPLVGAHMDIECVTCHSEGYDLASTCESCHLSDYSATSVTASPDHTLYDFPKDCLACHGQSHWKPSTFDHGVELTGFAIEGAHLVFLPENCDACHASDEWSGLSSECYACHQSNFEATRDPDHIEEGYPENICETCHSQDAWEPSIFEHSATTTTCVTCHLIDYTGTVNPPHAEASFPTDCADCHSTEAWSPSSFTHDEETTGFLTDGTHTEIGCGSCHDNWDPPTEIRSCASSSCHLDNFTSTTNPPHGTMGFTQNCVDCHTTSTWSPSEFLHNEPNTGYPLEGAHASVACQSCHTTWQILTEPRTCADGSCHLSDYNGATDPNHLSASFPLDCEICHGVDAWEPSTFDHDGQNFPIYSGQHREEWNDCSQCHVNSADFGVFTCFGTGCHNVAEMNDDHCEGNECETCNGNTYPPSGVTPEDCLSCHPTGDEDDCGGALLNFFKMRTLPFPTEKAPNEKR